ncbi:DUF2059 domain-containing protein [Flavobacterium seoulense]|uniref:DUF2059 domain-containing protein n=1 Tax=Flavobacterium seoulense TaxID=1492738 RepID=A0A066WSR5_9FLAO|nr:DUF2059 domain-containing protein [Flavobacterium seoulense]KDN54024.1 hypothetical protein FEM21_28410 [Flavobacterium seoulense]
MKKSLLILSFCVLSFSANAQNTSKSEKINQLLELTGSGKIGIQVMNQMMEHLKSSSSDSKAKIEFLEEFKKEVKAEDIQNMIIPIYDKYYTESDIDQLITFYNSPIGKKMIATMPQVMTESIIAGQAWGKQIVEKYQAKLKEKGNLEK